MIKLFYPQDYICMYFALCAIDINFNLNNSNPRSNPQISFEGKRKRRRRTRGGTLAVFARLRGLVYFLPLNLSRTSAAEWNIKRVLDRKRVQASRDESRKVLGNQNLHFHHPGFRAFIIPSLRIHPPLPHSPQISPAAVVVQRRRTCSQRDVIRKQRALSATRDCPRRWRNNICASIAETNFSRQFFQWNL